MTCRTVRECVVGRGVWPPEGTVRVWWRQWQTASG